MTYRVDKYHYLRLLLNSEIPGFNNATRGPGVLTKIGLNYLNRPKIDFLEGACLHRQSRGWSPLAGQQAVEAEWSF